MPTPSIIVKFRESVHKIILRHVDMGTPEEIAREIAALLLQALSDREAEIVAGIEGEIRRPTLEGEVYDPIKADAACVSGWNSALKEIATKITKGEI